MRSRRRWRWLDRVYAQLSHGVERRCWFCGADAMDGSRTPVVMCHGCLWEADLVADLDRWWR